MKKIPLTITALLAAATLSAQTENSMKKYAEQLPQEGRGNVRVAYLGKSIDEMVYEFMEQEGIPGMTLAIVQAPYIPRVAGYGVADLAQGRLAAVKTLWPAGPISQGFAAVAVMQLYERGKLDLKDSLGKYLKGLPEAWKDVTVFELLQHSTGIADYREQAGFDASKKYTTEQLTALVAAIPLAFESGTEVRQSATNFLLLAEVIEKISKMSYSDFVRKNQIDFLGLKQTLFKEELAGVKQEDLAKSGGRHERFKQEQEYIDPAETTVGYVEQQGRLTDVPLIDGSAFRGFADIWASAEDISHWDIGLAGGTLIAKPENRALIYGPTTLKNGKTVPAMAGWQFYGHKGLMDIKGSVPGHSAYLSRFTDVSELVCVTLLANKEGVDLTNLARRIAAAFDDGKLGTGSDDNLLYTYESQFGVDQTVSRIERRLEKLGIPVFAVFDHGKNAEEVGLEMRPAKVVVFGSPKVGTELMQENPAISLELPLKIAVWEDAQGCVWVNFPRMRQMAAEYGMRNNPIVANMQSLLEGIVRKAASVY